MITYIILLFIIGYWLNTKDELDLFNILCSNVIILLITEFLCFIIYVQPEYQPYKTENTNIYSLSGVSGVSGSFTFGTGTVESKPVYYFAFKVADKTYRIKKISGDVVFTLDNPQQPYIETSYSKLNKIDTDSIGYKYFVTDIFNISKEKVSYKIHLPETAIQQLYNAMPN